MANRTASMEVIDKALADPETPLVNESTLVPDIAPGVENPRPLADDGDGDEAPTTGEEDQELSARQQQIDDALARRAEEKDAFEENANATVNAIQRIARNTGVTIERFPTPGSVMFPLLVLLIFMFLLLPINGHTRLVWLWLVITGNASTGGAAQSPIFQELAINAPPILNPGQSTSHAPPILNPGQQASLSFAGNEHPS